MNDNVSAGNKDYDADMTEFERVVLLMNAPYFNIQKMSDAVDLPIATLYAIRRGSIRNPRMNTLFKILNYFRPKVVVSGEPAPVTPFAERQEQPRPLGVHIGPITKAD